MADQREGDRDVVQPREAQQAPGDADDGEDQAHQLGEPRWPWVLPLAGRPEPWPHGGTVDPAPMAGTAARGSHRARKRPPESPADQPEARPEDERCGQEDDRDGGAESGPWSMRGGASRGVVSLTVMRFAPPGVG